ncbi:MAG: hypothetical protein D6814_13760, partial [Calditrichaeota bacterium]
MKEKIFQLLQTWRQYLKSHLSLSKILHQGYYLHIAIGVFTVIAIVAMFPREKSYEFADLKEGEIYIGEQVVAPFTFSINKTPEEYNRDVEAAKRSVAPIFNRVDTVATFHIKELNGLLDGIETILKSIAVDSTKRSHLTELLKSYNIVASNEILDFFATRVNVISNKKPSRSDTARLQSKIPFQTFREILNKITRDIYSIGILNVAPEDLPNHPEKVAISTGNDELIE